jgi:hypothetical protein
MDEHTPGVWVDLPVPVHGMAAEEDRADGGDIRRANKDVADTHSELHVGQPGAALLAMTLNGR